ncbi:hypothetical protein, partial [Thermococcus sp.]
MSEDIPSINEVVKSGSVDRVPKIYPEGVRFSKKWRLFKTAWAGVVLIVISFFVIGYAAAMSPKYYWKPVDHWSKSWTIGPGEVWHNSWTVREPVENELFEINISVVGGSNDLRVYVDTPKGRVDYGKLISPIHLRLNLSRYGPGVYKIYYDNSFSVITSKRVSVVQTVYVLKEDTSDKDGVYFIAIFFLIIPGLILVAAGTRKVATLVVEDDIVEAKLVAWNKLELKVNGYKLDERLDHEVKFKAGQNENRVVNIKPVRVGWNAR